jgi:DNA adenine methylase
MSVPFLKWPGGKRWLATTIVNRILPHPYARYFEPFLGGGAVFFRLRPRIAILSDINEDLINVYVQVRDHPSELIKRLKRIRVSERQYYVLRENIPDCPFERAVRFLYLNRTAFGGIYRLNRDGQFNVPYGGGERTPEGLWRDRLIEKASDALQDVQILVSDFESIIDQAQAHDVVYCDPTYTVAHENNGFVRYNEQNFSWSDQKRLAAACLRAMNRGATVIMSNAYHHSIRKLYPEAQKQIIERKSLVSRKAEGRRVVHEYLLVLKRAS